MILLRADIDGPAWKDEKIREAVGCRVQTVECVRRIPFVDTPQHGRWLNMAECELSRLTRQSLSDCRFGELEVLPSEIASWANRTNARRRAVDRQFTVEKARIKRKGLYPIIYDGRCTGPPL